jgi:hypothetical protein
MVEVAQDRGVHGFGLLFRPRAGDAEMAAHRAN